MSGTATQPAVAATVDGKDLVAYRETWGTLAARINLVGPRASGARVAIDKPQPQGNGRITGSGTYHLDRRLYTADVQSRGVELANLTLPDGRPLRGTFNLDARSAGSIDAPAGTVSLTADGVEFDTYKIGPRTARYYPCRSARNNHRRIASLCRDRGRTSRRSASVSGRGQSPH